MMRFQLLGILLSLEFGVLGFVVCNKRLGKYGI